MNTEEARLMAEGKECSLLHITRAEIDFPEGIDSHLAEVYEKSQSNFTNWQKKAGWFMMLSPTLHLCSDNERADSVWDCRMCFD
jgi:uncharacterized protein (DUF1015 family)